MKKILVLFGTSLLLLTGCGDSSNMDTEKEAVQKKNKSKPQEKKQVIREQ